MESSLQGMMKIRYRVLCIFIIPLLHTMWQKHTHTPFHPPFPPPSPYYISLLFIKRWVFFHFRSNRQPLWSLRTKASNFILFLTFWHPVFLSSSSCNSKYVFSVLCFLFLSAGALLAWQCVYICRDIISTYIYGIERNRTETVIP